MTTSDDQPTGADAPDEPDRPDEAEEAPVASDEPDEGEGEAEAPAAPAAARSPRVGARSGSARSGSSSPSGGLARTARRYGPFVAVAAVIAAVVVVFGGGDDGVDDDAGGGDGGSGGGGGGSSSYEDLVLSGPMTPIRAELEGVDFTAGPNCDTETGRIMLPTVYAAPCVEPFDGDNGGATSMGITEDTIKVIAYRADPSIDPVGAGLVTASGADLSPEAARETMSNYQALFDEVYETYGRRVELEFYTGTGPADDIEKARADAIAIAEQEPFAVLGGPLQTSQVFADELAEAGIVSFVQQPMPESFLAERAPLVWSVTTPNQASRLAAEAIGQLAGPGPAELAGSAELQEQDRVYALVHYNTEENEYEEPADELRDGLAEHGIELADTVEFILDPDRIQENARTIIARLEDRGVTTIIFFGDPLMPASLTSEATAQDYYPEWILGPSLLADTALFGRTFDQDQWGNGFGVAFGGTAGATEVSTAYSLHTWAYGEEPTSNIYGTLEPGMRRLYTGIQLAGPELTPETFRDGMFRMPPSGGGPVNALESFGNHGLWEGTDYGSSDDVSLIWWDTDAEGVDEVGNSGQGMYRFANGGQRYTLGEIPGSLEEAGIFDEEASEIEIGPDELPEEDRVPDYEPPDL